MKKILIAVGVLFSHLSVYASPIQLDFNWGDSHAVVTQIGENDKGQMKSQYEISLIKQDDQYLFTQKNPIVLTINGQDVRNNPDIQVIAPQLMMPSLIINKAGVPVDIKDFDAYLKSALSLFDKGTADLIERNPKIKESLYVKAAEPWMSWSAPWAGESLEINKPKVTTDFAEAFGSKFPQRNTLTYLGKYKSTPFIEITYQSALNNNGVDMKAMSETIQQISDGRKSKEKFPQKAIMSKTVNVHGIIEPKTLRPQQIEIVKVMKVELDGQSKEKAEKLTYLFEWK